MCEMFAAWANSESLGAYPSDGQSDVTSNDWEKLQTAFQRALKLSGGKRDAYLTQFTREHPKLGGQVRNLVVADGGDNRVLRAPIANAIRRYQLEIAATHSPPQLPR